jgi:hypothetical protein
MTFVITKIMALMEAATNRKRVEVALDDDKGMHHLEILRTIKNRFVQSRMGGLTYDPSKIITSFVDRQVSIIPKNIPGISNFEIKDEPAPKQLPRPDAELFEEINNMYLLGLDVPPSSLNQLGENEFSRSIATFNFFFNNKVINYQTKTCNVISEVLCNYVKYSNKLKEQIIDILKEEKAKPLNEEGNSKPEKLDSSDTITNEDVDNIDKLMNYIVSSIRIILPTSKLVYDQSNFEDLKRYIEIIEGLVNAKYPDEIIEDSELTDTFRSFKASCKSELISKYLNDSGAFEQFNIEALKEFDFSKAINNKQIFINMNKALKDIKIKIDNKLSGSESDNGSFDNDISDEVDEETPEDSSFKEELPIEEEFPTEEETTSEENVEEEPVEESKEEEIPEE